MGGYFNIKSKPKLSLSKGQSFISMHQGNVPKNLVWFDFLLLFIFIEKNCISFVYKC